MERLAQPESNVYELLDLHHLLAIHEGDMEDIAERENRIKAKWQADESKAAGLFISVHSAFNR